MTREEFNVNRFIEQAEELSGLKIAWLKSKGQLVEAKQAGLYDLYCDIFAEPPYCEKFAAGEVSDYFNEMVAQGGYVFMASRVRKATRDNLVAFTASIPLSAKKNVLDVVQGYVPTDKASYFAEDAVISSLRRMGISRVMKKILLVSNANAGFGNMILRTSAESQIQIAASEELGALRIGELTQDVDSLRLDGTVKSDKRVFFNFDLNPWKYGV